jgi:VIT1/CCC1 family predicted Fe2+/Mn2+ transporter
MGANDGIVSTACVVLGVAGPEVGQAALFASAIAAVVAGGLSMALGEYVSVSTQRDSQQAALGRESARLAASEHRIGDLAEIIHQRGIEPRLAHQVATQLTQKNALAAHARLELGIDPDELVNPWHAALSSMVAFVVGDLIPLLPIALAPAALNSLITAGVAVAALALTGSISAQLGRASKWRAAARTTGGGILAMLVSYGVGAAVGTQLHV